MLTNHPPAPRRRRRLVAGTARSTTRFACLIATVLLIPGPALWLLGTISGDEVSVAGGVVRVVTQLVLAAACAQVARSPRSVPWT